MGDLFNNKTETNTRHISDILSQRLTDIFHQDAFSSINKENNKLRTYGLVKSSVGLENYLIMITNLKHRNSLTQIRLSSHRLMIETGRHKKIPARERFCPFCKTEVEDEIHFVVKCKTYDNLRKPLFELCADLKQNFDHYTDQDKFVFILTTEYLQITLAKFVFLAEEFRSSLILNHENSG